MVVNRSIRIIHHRATAQPAATDSEEIHHRGQT
jgi:hypothetical protein